MRIVHAVIPAPAEGWSAKGGKAGICLLLLFSLSCWAQAQAQDKGEEGLFKEANSFYEKGEYQKAVSGYEKILETGVGSGPIYYNLANAYFKLGELGKAVINYERGLRLMPRDADLVANYKFARAMVKEAITPKKGLWAARPLDTYSRDFTVNELMWMCSGIYILILILLVIILVLPNIRQYLTIIVFIILAFLLFNTAIIWHKVVDIGTKGTIIVEKDSALFGPFDSATKFFTINEGAEIIVLKKKDDWYKIRRGDGKVGWVKADSVEII